MNQKGKRTLTPKLRFPEFRDKGEWEPTTIGEHVNLLSGFPFEGMDIIEDSAGVPLMRGINITEGRIRHDPDYDRFYLGPTETLARYRLQEGDLVIGMDGSKVGKNSAMITSADAGALLVQRVARLHSNRQVTMRFIFQIVNSPKFHSYVDRINTSSGIPHISAKQINDFPLAIPCDAEQKKIAECLSSLDGLIAAEGRKLAALRDHKRGLMQQLFPQPGQTQPRLRFPEFRDKGEWESSALRDCGEIVTGMTPSTKNTDLWGGEVLFITPTDISEEHKYQHNTQRNVVETKSTRVLPAGSIVYTCIASIGKMAITVHASTTNQQINTIIPKHGINNEFIYYSLISLTPWIKSIPASSTLPIINKSEFSKICVMIPLDPQEQQRIADCLTALDSLITAHAAKIDALKQHKRGLMQQLFPAPEGQE